MCQRASRDGLQDSVTGQDDDDCFVQVDLIKKREMLMGGGNTEQAKEFSECCWLVDAPERDGLVVVIGCPSTTPCQRVEFTGCSVGTHDDVGVGCLEQCEFFLALIFVAGDEWRDMQWH